MIKVKTYDRDDGPVWDDFIDKSKNGSFLFFRDYMDYHADRFVDHSLMFYEDNRLVAVIPANLKNDQLISHGGLTYGGVISDSKMKVGRMLQVFEALRAHLRRLGVKQVIYKAIPHIYHAIPAEEDLYAIFINHGHLFRRDVSSTILLAEKPRFSKGRRWCIKKGRSTGLHVKRDYDFETFMEIETQQLMQKHNKRPVHTAAEMQQLAERFPQNIKLFAAYQGETMLGGTIIYESKEVAHAQYIGATDQGKDEGTLDIVLDFLINEYYRDKKFFDFGISTDRDGYYLDQGLVANKESFGARTITYDFYQINIDC
jgi:hypothetical protein